MAEFNFQCPFCGKEIKAYPEMIGQVGNCPYCDAEVTIDNLCEKRNPLPPPQKTQSQLTPKTTTGALLIECKACGKQISRNAAACPHCGEQNSQKETCPYCNKPVDPNTHTCPNCTHSFYSTNPVMNFLMFSAVAVIIWVLLTIIIGV